MKYHLQRRFAHPRVYGFLAVLCWVSAALSDPVSVRALALDDLLQTANYSAPASVVARNRPQVAAEIDARVVSIPVQVGDHVAPGETLAQLDCRSHESRLAAARAELDSAQARLRHARAQLVRASNLKKNESISDELLGQRRMELETGEAQVGAQQERVQQAAIDVGHCQIKAPFDAVVTVRLVSEGAFVARGNPLIGLLELDGQEVSAALREAEVTALEDANDLVFESAGTRYPVRLRTLLPAVDTLSRTREARLSFLDRPALAGTAGRLAWHGDRQLLPADYLVRRDGRLGVFTVDDNRARFVAVPQAQEGRPAAVDLPPDTRLISDGRQGLSDGQEVNLIPPREQP